MGSFPERFPRLWAALDVAAVLLLGGFLFWLLALPVVTLPAAFTGLCALVGTVLRVGPGGALASFWRAFRRSLWTAAALGALNVAAGLLLWYDMRFFAARSGLLAGVAAFVLATVGAEVLLINVYAWPLLAWYPQGLRSLLKRAFLLAHAHPLPAIGAVAGAALGSMLLVLGPIWVMLPVSLILSPVVLAGAFSLGAWQGMKRYVKPEDQLDE